MKIVKYFIFLFVAAVVFAIQGQANAAVGVAPSYVDNFSKYLTQEISDSHGRVETVYDLGIDSSKSLKDNIRCLFYPNSYLVPGCESSSAGGKIRDVVRYIGFGILVVFLVMAGVQLILNGNDSEKVKLALKSLIYILYGSLLFFGVTWILGGVLGVETVQGTQGMVDALQGGPDSLFFKMLTMLKALAFFIAIIMLVVYGFKIMAASDQSDKIKTMLTGIINVVVALIIVKIIDYVYYIAQLPSFTEKATEFIIEISKIFGFIMGATLVLMFFYAGFLMLTDQGKSENIKKAKNMIIGVLLAGLVVFMLLLIMYQIFAEFGGLPS